MAQVKKLSEKELLNIGVDAWQNPDGSFQRWDYTKQIWEIVVQKPKQKMRNEINWADKNNRDEELVLDRIMALALGQGFECEIIDGQMIIKDSERKICYGEANGNADGVAVLYDYEYEEEDTILTMEEIKVELNKLNKI